MTAHFMRRACAAVLAATAVFALSACTPSETQQTEDKKELTSRGFTDPTYLGTRNAFASHGGAAEYGVGLGSCRLIVVKDDEGNGFIWEKDADYSYSYYSRLEGDEINATYMASVASTYGLSGCLRAPTAQK